MKRIIVCCDGTWNDLKLRYITNVGRLVQALLPHGKSGNKSIPQMIYYDDGVGADSNGLTRMVEGATGMGIDAQIYNAYRFICINYEPGDELFLFGFSRGAFAARSVAGMIGKVGVVSRSELKYLPGALTAYRSKNTKKQQEFVEESNSNNKVKISVLGCWDTVGSLGIPDKIPFLPIDNFFHKKYKFHDTNLGQNIEKALHAVAIDERRKEFGVTLMNKPKGAPAGQKLVQHWFPGDHSSVGGSSWEKRGLSNRCLKWMLDEIKAMGVSLGVDVNRLHDKGISDCGVFFSDSISLIYGKKDRTMPEKVVEWQDIDETAKRRWLEMEEYCPPALKKRFSAKFKNLDLPRIRKTPLALTRLNVGQKADVRVESRSKSNRSFIEVKSGEHYQVEVNRLQVWKDGNLDPCDVLGWNTISKGKNAKIPYENDEKVDLGTIKSKLIKSAKNKKLVKEADWFELVFNIGDKKFKSLNIKQPSSETEPFQMEFKADADGELHFTANDLSSRFDIIDKYDNNSGWVWISVKRK